MAVRCYGLSDCVAGLCIHGNCDSNLIAAIDSVIYTTLCQPFTVLLSF